jgi:YfiH family protein
VSNSFRLGADGIYRCDAFQQFLWQEHGFGTRNGNPPADVLLRQVHSNAVVNANTVRPGADETARPEGDAVISDLKGRSIGVRSADCVPILLLDSKTRAVAAVHAGWRGAVAQVTARTLTALQDAFGTDPADVYAAIGPCIRPCCYEVGEEVAKQFSEQFPEWAAEEKLRWTLDLPEANRRQLLRGGVKEDRIFDCCLCTTCLPEQFYSYRREPKNPGRMISSIARLA